MKFQSECKLVNSRFERIISRAKLIASDLRELLHDISSPDELGSLSLQERLLQFQDLSFKLMSLPFHQRFAAYLTRNGALSRYSFTGLALNRPVSLSQSIPDLTQVLFKEGGLVCPKLYHFYLYKVLSLYETTREIDSDRLKQSHVYLDLTQFYYAFRALLRVIVKSAGQPSCDRHQIYPKMTDLLSNLEALISDF